ncbi:hypothetical protein ASPACDRAFT_128242 [Aspergillus aculeatus ATCC 16872]|uniref:DDE-1 domain-containing protein n=1 Tax=Aspergillus aculeatus (strain ATCC 16872 / CBS 172.66 / WB 5094) TaxID=690307 RepID=A0A1L9WEI0_ASPA1|nr:uncharacterized protein ASPACDRAFT_128242 [Aspergillus aculeatus ATCC 16872]OJJ94592.1 hypothetical protein ASPACDRAFT_128242 [Aspergillus aculeatus ATCC 16872]
MDETGFQMGVASTARVICGSEIRESRAKCIQPGNREWVTLIVAISASGTVLPPQIIFAAQNHQSIWYEVCPRSYHLSVSENGWTTNELGFDWLQNVFDRYTALKTVGEYCMLILDGHGSHATQQFDQFCTARKIIPLYMPAHSSHKLQPLDVACFGPLKKLYGQRVSEAICYGEESITKLDFLQLYHSVHAKAFFNINILSGFRATGLVPLNSQKVLSTLRIQLKTPTPPTSSHSNQSFYLGKTPANLYELGRQRQEIQELADQGLASMVSHKVIEKVIKAAEQSMQNAVLLQQ